LTEELFNWRALLWNLEVTVSPSWRAECNGMSATVVSSCDRYCREWPTSV